MDNQEKLAAYW